MKILIILIICVAPLFAFAQSPSAEYEKAYFEVTKNGASAFYTEIHCSSGPFNKEHFYSLKETMEQKDGVFLISYLEEGKTIRIAHLSFVDPETIKSFGNTICNGITVDERQPFSF